MADVAQAMNASVDFDQRLLPHDVAGSTAHARMLAAVRAAPTPLHRMQHAEALLVAHDLRARPELLTRARAALAPLRASAPPDDARLGGLLAELFPPGR